LPGQQEQLSVLLSQAQQKALYYQQLLELGFRRSGDSLYAPACPTCSQCQSLRVNVQQFAASRSQKRLLNKTAAVHSEWQQQLNDDDYQLFARYIEARHKDGPMYPTSRKVFDDFLGKSWSTTHYLKLYHQQQLIAVCVSDVLPQALSAVYTFFEPSLSHLSLGRLAVLRQIEHANKANKTWLYLGFQIDACQKMNYKSHYLPNQRYIEGKWQ
jgi:arginine-tRNA-protein transferase